MRLVGACAPNAVVWPARTWDYIRESKVQSLKVMSDANPAMVRHARALGVAHFMVRLYVGSPRHRGGMGTPAEFVRQVVGHIEAFLAEGITLFEIHNEPNHDTHLEGWGDTDQDARDFCEWFIGVYTRLKLLFPEAQFGFPGLAVPHRDLEWLVLCEPAIRLADFVCSHVYWQTPPDQQETYKGEFWGGRYRNYHRFSKDIYIAEFGNSNVQTPGLNTDPHHYAPQIEWWLNDVARDGAVKAVYGFILCSDSPEWSAFEWHDPIRQAVARVQRGALPAPKPPPVVVTPPAPKPSQPPKETPPMTNVVDPRIPWVTVEPANVLPGQKVWRVTKVEVAFKGEFGGDHHIFIRAPRGNLFCRVSNGVALESFLELNQKPEPEAPNHEVMYANNVYNARMTDRERSYAPSDVVRGMKMRGVENDHDAHHTSYAITFELQTQGGTPTTGTFRDRALARAAKEQVLRINPDGALEKKLLSMGYIKTSPEWDDVGEDGKTQAKFLRGERMADRDVVVVWTYHGQYGQDQIRVIRLKEAGGGNDIFLERPYFRQLGHGADLVPGDCGPACVKMEGRLPDPVDNIAVESGQFAGDDGTSPDELVKGAKANGLQLTKKIYTRAQLRKDLEAGKGVIALVHYPSLPIKNDMQFRGGHYVLVVGVTDTHVIYHDPYWRTDQGKAVRCPAETFWTAWANATINGNAAYRGLCRK